MGRPGKLTMDFFIHDADASSDIKIRLLSKKHGNDGYATYFRLLEALCHEPGMILSLANAECGELLAEDFHLRDVQHLYKIIQHCAEIGLIDRQIWESERAIFSHGLYDRYLARLEDRKAAAERQRKSREAKSLQDKINDLESVVTRDNHVTSELSRKRHSTEAEYRTTEAEYRDQKQNQNTDSDSEESTVSVETDRGHSQEEFQEQEPGVVGTLSIPLERKETVSQPIESPSGGKDLPLAEKIPKKKKGNKKGPISPRTPPAISRFFGSECEEVWKDWNRMYQAFYNDSDDRREFMHGLDWFTDNKPDDWTAADVIDTVRYYVRNKVNALESNGRAMVASPPKAKNFFAGKDGGESYCLKTRQFRLEQEQNPKPAIGVSIEDVRKEIGVQMSRLGGLNGLLSPSCQERFGVTLVNELSDAQAAEYLAFLKGLRPEEVLPQSWRTATSAGVSSVRSQPRVMVSPLT